MTTLFAIGSFIIFCLQVWILCEIKAEKRNYIITRAGDTLILKSNTALTQEQIKRLERQISPIKDQNVKVVILDSILSFHAVIKKD